MERTMETATLKPYFVTIGVLIAAVVLLSFSVDVRTSDEAGIRMELPDLVGNWTGQDMLFCQNPVCLREYRAGDLGGATRCPACGGELDHMTRSEKDLLPKDTQILKKDYRNPNGRGIYATVVLSGKERVSIHRPQVCLVGQGYKILRSHVVSVPLQGRLPLKVMVLDLLRVVRTPEGQTVEAPFYFAYWFVGKDRETPYHVERMLWMASDRILRNVSHRWAYIAVSGLRDPGSESYKAELLEFVQAFYPQIALGHLLAEAPAPVSSR
jgi:hypothetical protein